MTEEVRERRLRGVVEMSKLINVGLIGFGYWGPNLIRNFSGLLDCQGKYACDVDAKRLDHMKTL